MNASKKIDSQDLFTDLQVSQNLAKDLLDLLKAENEALRRMDIRSLARTTKEKETLLVKIHYLDSRIAETVRLFFTNLGEENKKMVDLAPFLSQEQAAVLQQYNANLVSLRQDIHTKNLINKRFTHDTLHFIDDAISIFTAQPKKNELYGNRGVARYSNKTPTMISREV